MTGDHLATKQRCDLKHVTLNFSQLAVLPRIVEQKIVSEHVIELINLVNAKHNIQLQKIIILINEPIVYFLCLFLTVNRHRISATSGTNIFL